MEHEPAMERGGRWPGWPTLAVVSATVTYLLVVLGGIVRITESGMGCGDDWPLCNGAVIPSLDLTTWIEFGHRLVAAVVAGLVVALAVRAWRTAGRDVPGSAALRLLTGTAVALLVVQILLGAITVWRELPPSSVVLHLGTGMTLLGILVVTSVFGRSPDRSARAADGAASVGWWVAAFGFAAILAGALVANYDAAPACQGFPLCNGQLLPQGGWRIQIHWVHRTLAYLMAACTPALLLVAARRRPADRAARQTAWLAVGLVVLQLAVAATMVLSGLPAGLRALHVAVGAAAFSALVAHAWLMGHPRPGSPEPA